MKSTTSVIAISFVLASSLLGAQAQAQSVGKTAHYVNFSSPHPPEDIGEPGVRGEASSRGACESKSKQINDSKQKPLTALVPAYGATHSGLVWGETTSDHPTFWFYVPPFGSGVGKFILQKAEKTIYESSVSLPKAGGFVKISLPSRVASLKTGQQYHWFFDVYCHAGEPPTFVHGWIKRELISPILTSKLRKMTTKQRVITLAAHGIWYDALATSAEIRYLNPEDTDWSDLLRSVGLYDVASEPLFTTETLNPIAQQNERNPTH